MSFPEGFDPLEALGLGCSPSRDDGGRFRPWSEHEDVRASEAPVLEKASSSPEMDAGPAGEAGRPAEVSQAEVERLRKLLDRTWYAFLGRFPRPTRVQVEAIPVLLAGANALIASATATGKTEAYTAPLAERALREGWKAPSVLIVSPTRALANDLCRRLEVPLQRVGVTVQRKTGDHPSFDDASPAQMVITTPESLDSLLSRRPDALKTVRAVVLDELHVLDGTARGDQLALLMSRLERIVQGTAAQAAVRGHALALPLQRIAATATVDDIDGVASRYLGRSYQLVRTGERRVIEADFVAGSDALAVRSFLVERCGRPKPGGRPLEPAAAPGGGGLEESAGATGSSAVSPAGGLPPLKLRKVLLFANSRAEAEDLAAALTGYPPFGSDVFVHHGSLHPSERERVESRFLQAASALCVATMTLELGIDIGDIDCVGLLGPPHDVASLLQRVGRGNRRSWDTTRVVCFYDTPGQRLRFEHLLDCARRGHMQQAARVFRPSVLVQQAFSMLFQNRNRFVEPRSWAERLPALVASEYPAPRLEEVLGHLVHDGFLLPMSGGRYGPTDKLLRMYERGQMHANISGDSGDTLEVIDAVTERVVGYLPRPAEERGARGGGRGAGMAVPDEIVLGGQARQVHGIKGRQIRTTSTGARGGAKFASQGSPSVSRELAQSMARFAGIDECRLPVVQARGRIYVAHFLGSCYGRLFLECVQRVNGGRSGAGNGFVSVFAGESMPCLEFREGDVLAEISKHRKALSGALQDGPWSPRLPLGWWVAWLCESLDVPAFLELHDTWQVQADVPDDLAEAIISLAPRGAQ